MVWVFSALVMAAAIAPWIYQSGKSLAAAAESQDLAAIWEWLGAACGRAKFDRFFSRSLMFSALVLLPFLLWHIRRLRASGMVQAPLPAAKFGWRQVLMQVLAGCLIAGGFLWMLALLLESLGVYTPNPKAPELAKLLKRVLIPTVAAPLVEEPLFRGLLLGLWLRFTRPFAACVGTSLLFAFLHFLEPPDGAVIADRASRLAGFELLGKILFHFADPRFFVTDFATLFAVGMILAWARLRTGALWFSIGLHAGWVAAFKCSTMLYRTAADHSLHPWGVGDNVRSGFLPMLTLGLTAVVCHFAMKRFVRPESSAHHGQHENSSETAAS